MGVGLDITCVCGSEHDVLTAATRARLLGAVRGRVSPARQGPSPPKKGTHLQRNVTGCPNPNICSNLHHNKAGRCNLSFWGAHGQDTSFTFPPRAAFNTRILSTLSRACAERLQYSKPEDAAARDQMVAQPSTLRAYTKTGRHVVKLQLGLQKQQHAIRTRRTQIGGRAHAALRAEVCAFRWRCCWD
jgi:hypothetical protein